jgi:Flp pilus assembly protein CpaB
MAKRLRARPSNTLLLVFGSVVILALVTLAALNRPLPSYLVAASNLAPGMQLSTQNTTTQQLNLGSLANSYVTAENSAGMVLLQPVVAGELIPIRVLGRGLAFGETSLRFTPALKPAGQITPGSRVAIWQVVELADGFESQLLVQSALVTDLQFGEGLFAGELPEVEILLSEPFATLLLQSLASENAIYLLPLP